ncbi:Leucine-rich repeat-containing protein 43 [Geranomyces variabilis]|uniref:Leucine-rich repeat-containing protein 43 n=1 Tax=Geranomyces variabilis TaxID=109894 RepID=A0AAD5XJX0_9FUNG|nr:Leucine-rich repeat-containing protein 43 [Geranomyces variabilis]
MMEGDLPIAVADHPVAATTSFYELLDSATGIRPDSDPLHIDHRRSPSRSPEAHAADASRPRTRRSNIRVKANTKRLPPLKKIGGRGADGLVDLDPSLMEGAYAPDPEVDIYQNASLDWSPEAETLRKLKRGSQNPVRIASHFKTLLLHDRGITVVDHAFRAFENLEELSLTGNNIPPDAFAGVPSNLQILTVNANMLPAVPTIPHLTKLIHIGMSHNQITSLSPCEQAFAAPKLMSVDASWNHIDDLEETMRVALRWQKLRSLVLMGNPVFLIPGYRQYVLSRLPALAALDDIPVSRTAPTTTKPNDSTQRPTTLNPRATLKFRLATLLNPPFPNVRPLDPASSPPHIPTPQPPDLYAFQIRLSLPGYWEMMTPPVPALMPAQMEDAADEKGGKKKKKEKEKEEAPAVEAIRRLEFAFETMLGRTADWPLAKSLIDGLTLTLLETRQTHVPVAPAEDAVGTRPASSQSHASRRTSTTVPNAAPVKGKNAKQQSSTALAKQLKASLSDESAAQSFWNPGPIEYTSVGVVHIPLASFLEGNTQLEGDYILEHPDHPTPPRFAGTLTLAVQLNP